MRLASLNPAVVRGQTVVVTYTDPTSGDDAIAIQDVGGNDVASFTTGLNGVPAVVNDSGVNSFPTVATAIQDRSATVGTSFSYQFPADTFRDANGDTLTYMATKGDGTPLPTWLTFAAASRTFSGTPQAGDTGMVSVRVTATDGNRASVSDTFVITVSTTANTAPTTTGGRVTTPEGTAYTFSAADFNFSDSDPGDTLASVIITSVPDVVAGTVNVNGTPVVFTDLPKTVTKADIDARNLTFTPPANTGSASFTFRVNDGEADSTTGIMTITVGAATNAAPTVANMIPDQRTGVGTAYRYEVPANTFNDTDNDPLTYSATQADNSALPTWLTFTAATRIFSGTPQAADAGIAQGALTTRTKPVPLRHCGRK